MSHVPLNRWSHHCIRPSRDARGAWPNDAVDTVRRAAQKPALALALLRFEAAGRLAAV